MRKVLSSKYVRFFILLFIVSEPLIMVLLYNVVEDSYHYEPYDFDSNYLNFVGLRSKNSTYDFVKFIPYELRDGSLVLRNITIESIINPIRIDIRICFNTLFIDKNLGKILIKVAKASLIILGNKEYPQVYNVTMIVGNYVSGYFFVDGQIIYSGQANYDASLEVPVDAYDSQKIYSHDYLAIDISLPKNAAKIAYMEISLIFYKKYLVLSKNTKILALAIFLSGLNIALLATTREFAEKFKD